MTKTHTQKKPVPWYIAAKYKAAIDWDEYRARVEELEAEGMTTSDAQSIADMELERGEV